MVLRYISFLFSLNLIGGTNEIVLIERLLYMENVWYDKRKHFNAQNI